MSQILLELIWLTEDALTRAERAVSNGREWSEIQHELLTARVHLSEATRLAKADGKMEEEDAQTA